ncbi:MAG: head-tail connector protein, partial [Synergistaceae bacterium]|nr:head-tail connector protein [Synergistaceae bacterium]
MDRAELRQKADRRFELMLEDRRDWEPWWRELSRQFAPWRGRFRVGEEPKKGPLRKNSRPCQIPDDFAAGIKSGLTSPSRPWFTLTLYDNRLAENERVKAWLTKVQDVMQGQMIRTNLYDQLFDVYKEQGIFGTGALFIEEDDEDVFRATCMTVGSWCIGLDRRGKVCRFGRDMARTGAQLAEEFGEEALPEAIRAALRERPTNTRYELRNLIEPDEEGERPWRSLWWLKGYDDPAFLRVSGYWEMPVMVPRWRVVGGDVYGREQPGDVALDDAKTLQELEADERAAIKRGVCPPVVMPVDMVQGELKNWPGGVTVYTPIQDRPVIAPLYQVQFDHQSAAAKRLELTAHIEEAFYVNFFRMWTTDQRQGRTATEIEAREAEKMYMLGPLIERQQSEMLDPLIARIFGIMDRRGMFPPPPEELSGEDMKIEYTSILASIQKQTAQAGIDIVLERTGQIMQIQGAAGERPSILDKIDFDEVVDQLADMYALPAGVVLGDD